MMEGTGESMRAAIAEYLEESKRLIDRFDQAAIARAAELLLGCYERRRRVWTIGNGGSASTAQHLACDLGKYVIPQGARPFDARCLTDNVSLYTAWANDAERDQVFVNLMRGLVAEGDVAVLVSVHGGDGFSKDLVHAAQFAKDGGARVIALVGFDGGPLHRMADCSLLVPARSTPHSEGLHLVIHHLLMHLVRERLAEPKMAKA
jgi:D-sedoheptulose 7-phosphate isomerase